MLLTELSQIQHQEEPPSEIRDRDSEITHVTFSPNALVLAVGSRDKVIDLYALGYTGPTELEVVRIGE